MTLKRCTDASLHNAPLALTLDLLQEVLNMDFENNDVAMCVNDHYSCNMFLVHI